MKNDGTRYDDDCDNCKRKLDRIFKQKLPKFNNFSRIVSNNILKVMETYLVKNIDKFIKTIFVKNDGTRHDDDGDNCKRKLTRIYKQELKQELPKYNNFPRLVVTLLKL